MPENLRIADRDAVLKVYKQRFLRTSLPVIFTKTSNPRIQIICSVHSNISAYNKVPQEWVAETGNNACAGASCTLFFGAALETAEPALYLLTIPATVTRAYHLSIV